MEMIKSETNKGCNETTHFLQLVPRMHGHTLLFSMIILQEYDMDSSYLTKAYENFSLFYQVGSMQ